MEKIIFNYEHNGQVVAQFDSESEKYKALINIAINELQKVIHLKGHIYGSTLAPSNSENFKDDLKILMSCDIAIRTLKTITEQPIE